MAFIVRVHQPAMDESHELQQRLKQAQEIISSPSKYKVCEGCFSIVSRQTRICPNCHSYRFDDHEERIISHAKELSSRPSQSVGSNDLL